MDYSTLRDRGAKHNYYLQLRENLRQYRLLRTPEQLVQLVLFALEADFGPYKDSLLMAGAGTGLGVGTPGVGTGTGTGTGLTCIDRTLSSNVHTLSPMTSSIYVATSYFDPLAYFPPWVCSILLLSYIYSSFSFLSSSLPITFLLAC